MKGVQSKVKWGEGGQCGAHGVNGGGMAPSPPIVTRHCALDALPTEPLAAGAPGYKPGWCLAQPSERMSHQEQNGL